MRPEFVDGIPELITPNTLYICIRYNTAVHLCACGCGQEVVTPLSPAAWRIIYDGEHISLYPSIGNWQFPCESHYWITNNEIQWAEHWSKDRITSARNRDQNLVHEWYANKISPEKAPSSIGSSSPDSHQNFNLWLKFKKHRPNNDGPADAAHPRGEA